MLRRGVSAETTEAFLEQKPVSLKSIAAGVSRAATQLDRLFDLRCDVFSAFLIMRSYRAIAVFLCSAVG